MEYIKKHWLALLIFIWAIVIASLTWQGPPEEKQSSNQAIKQQETSINLSDGQQTQSVRVDHDPPVQQNITDNISTSSSEQLPIPINTSTLKLITLQIEGTPIEIELHEGDTLYDIMNRSSALSFTSRNFGGNMGHFIESINGKTNDMRAGLYWIYYINGQSATKGVSLYKPDGGDVITWKYEKSTI